jgi:hypothetical protein
MKKLIQSFNTLIHQGLERSIEYFKRPGFFGWIPARSKTPRNAQACCTPGVRRERKAKGSPNTDAQIFNHPRR